MVLPAVDNEEESSFGLSDDDFRALMYKAIQDHPLAADYPSLFEAAPVCWTAWRRRFRGNAVLWKRLFDQQRVVKEFIEAVPVMDAVQRIVTASSSRTTGSTASSTAATTTTNNNSNNNNDGNRFTILDLCSGKGYLSMMLSELLLLANATERVERFILADKAWPQHGATPGPHHIGWQHIYGSRKTSKTNQDNDSDNGTYYNTWPIPLNTHKVDLKHSNQRRKLAKRYLENPKQPVILLGIHLCGTLSIHAVRLFVENPSHAVHFLALKPCCLPGMVHAKRDEQFCIGNYKFAATDVCVAGKWNKNAWRGGPPRAQRALVFHVWTRHLYSAVAQNDNDTCGDDKHDDTTTKTTTTTTTTKQQQQRLVCVPVQQNGGYQNDFVLAQRAPVTTDLWNEVLPEQKKEESDIVRETLIEQTEEKEKEE